MVRIIVCTVFFLWLPAICRSDQPLKTWMFIDPDAKQWQTMRMSVEKVDGSECQVNLNSKIFEGTYHKLTISYDFSLADLDAISGVIQSTPNTREFSMKCKSAGCAKHEMLFRFDNKPITSKLVDSVRAMAKNDDIDAVRTWFERKIADCGGLGSREICGFDIQPYNAYEVACKNECSGTHADTGVENPCSHLSMLTLMYERGDGVVRKNANKAIELNDWLCENSKNPYRAEACHRGARLTLDQVSNLLNGGDQDEARKMVPKLNARYRKACDAGISSACNFQF